MTTSKKIKMDVNEDSNSVISFSSDNDSESEESDFEKDYNALREEALTMISKDRDGEEDLSSFNDCALFPPDFLKSFTELMEPKTMGGIVALSDSSSEDEGEENTSEPMCTVPSCSSRKRVKIRSRLVTSYYGLTYMESPIICHRCFVKAAKFYLKVPKITPEKNKLLINKNLMKMTDCIDICDDGPSLIAEPVIIEDNSLAAEFCRNISIHVDNVAKKYNIEEKYNHIIQKMCSNIQKTTVWLNELNCKISMDDQAIVNFLQDLYESYERSSDFVEREPLDCGIVDADKPESNNVSKQLSSELRSSKSSVEIDVSDSNVAAIEVDDKGQNILLQSKPSNLPPRGLIQRKKPSVGQKVYVAFTRGDFKEWIPSVIESIIINENVENKFNYSYKVKIYNEITKNDYLKEVSEEDIAYFEPSAVRIAVGNRVISAVYSKNDDEPVKYYSGVVAESPSSNNNYRYLIFFDSMKVQYSKHEDLHVTCKMNEDIQLYFPLKFRPFINRYFELLPTRKILTVNTMDIIKVAYQGKWVDAKVTAVDGLLLEVFYNKNEPTEWLYRGSPRVLSRDMYRARLYRALSENMLPSPRWGVDATEDPIEVEKIKDILRSRLAKAMNANRDNIVRAVARKSTTKLPDVIQPSALSKSTVSFFQGKGAKDEYAGFIRTGRDLSGISFPKEMGKHECGEACLWTNTTVESCKGRNPLIIPMAFAFKRVDVTPMGGAARQIYYVSPCGKKLEDFDQLLAYLQVTKSQLSVDYFNFDPWVNVWDEFIAAPEGLVLNDLSYGKEFNNIRVVNTVDRELHPFMTYMVNRRATEGVPLNLDTDYLTCCDCEDDCSNKSKCACWQKTIKDYLDLIVKSNTEIDSNTNVIDYSYIGYQNKRLVEYVPSGIYECNSKCKCKHTCLNRVVQLPLKVKLELFKTKYKGWGTRCLNDIPAGGFICVYVGNILTEKAANEGGKTYGDEYFAELDYIEVMERLMNKPGYESGPSDPENTDGEDEIEKEITVGNMKLRKRKIDKEKKTRLKRSTTDHSRLAITSSTNQSTTETLENEKSKPSNDYIPLRHLYGNNEAVYIIDAKSAGNIGRYFNHSCEPNIFVQNVFVDTHDLRFPWVAFFAKHHIRAGSELTWDYQYVVDSVPGKKLYCYCSSKSCRGRLL